MLCRYIHAKLYYIQLLLAPIFSLLRRLGEVVGLLVDKLRQPLALLLQVSVGATAVPLFATWPSSRDAWRRLRWCAKERGLFSVSVAQSDSHFAWHRHLEASSR